MNNELTVLDDKLKALAAAAREEGGGILGGKLLKFAKGKYFVGDDEIKIGREFVAYPQKWVRGWTKFWDGKLAEQRVGPVADGFITPKRDELGDTDEALWEKDGAGNPKDPWQKQSYLPLEDCETGEIFVFVSGSHGGRGAIRDLVTTAVKNISNGDPRIALGVASYKHKTFGRVEAPHFPIKDWVPYPVTEVNDADVPF
jgi:hypothetical protein